MSNAKNFFSWSELTTTDTGLSNNPTSSLHLVNLARLWDYLNKLREKLGAPIFINSAFRTPAVNEQVGGVKCSKHEVGLAGDVRTIPSKMEALYYLLRYDYEIAVLSEFISYSTFFHFAL